MAAPTRRAGRGAMAGCRCPRGGPEAALAGTWIAPRRARRPPARRFDQRRLPTVPLSVASTTAAASLRAPGGLRLVHAHQPTTRPEVQEPTSEQAHVPAEQPPSGQDPRLPPADAHARRPCHPRGPALQGSHPPLGLSGASGRVPAASTRRLRRDRALHPRCPGHRSARRPRGDPRPPPGPPLVGADRGAPGGLRRLPGRRRRRRAQPGPPPAAAPGRGPAGPAPAGLPGRGPRASRQRRGDVRPARRRPALGPGPGADRPARVGPGGRRPAGSAART